MLICPVCGETLMKTDFCCRCQNNHSFDIAKEGYVNLLSGKHKNGSLIGDNKDMAKSRRAFLSKGYYGFLASALAKQIKASGKNDINCLDISCGEGWYTNEIKLKTGADVFGFDISKEMIKLAAKKYRDINFFVANISSIPVGNESVDAAVQICAPFNEKEFARILKKDGVLFSVVPGRYHLKELKEIIYDTPYDNNEDNCEYNSLDLADKITVSEVITVEGNEDVMNLFKMTPYYYKTSENDKQKLCNIDSVRTTAEFVIRKFVKK